MSKDWGNTTGKGYYNRATGPGARNRPVRSIFWPKINPLRNKNKNVSLGIRKKIKGPERSTLSNCDSLYPRIRVWYEGMAPGTPRRGERRSGIIPTGAGTRMASLTGRGDGSEAPSGFPVGGFFGMDCGWMGALGSTKERTHKASDGDTVRGSIQGGDEPPNWEAFGRFLRPELCLHLSSDFFLSTLIYLNICSSIGAVTGFGTLIRCDLPKDFDLPFV